MEFKHALQNHFKKGRLITLRSLKALKINKFRILRLPSEAMKNKVMLIKIVCFVIGTFQNFYVALWDS